MDTIKLQTLRLSDLATSETGIITRVAGYGAFRKRITEMGFVRGKKVTVIKNAPLRDPIEYEIMGYRVSLRRSEAHMIEIITGADDALPEIDSYFGSTDDNSVKDTVLNTTKTINIALVGNPNCGKTTLFNLASGAHERVGNYGGVTVDSKEAEIKSGGYTLKLTDLPGTYSITEYTPEELFVRGHIIDNCPDVIINVIDSSNLERNLFLTTQLIDMHVKV
ncbi:MAG: FeoA domain-containing protein, partial [Ignavibacteriales bacterium]|nr:FeoA domain-containing protein [Ignavibacteriales bacterium]